MAERRTLVSSSKGSTVSSGPNRSSCTSGESRCTSVTTDGVTKWPGRSSGWGPLANAHQVRAGPSEVDVPAEPVRRSAGDERTDLGGLGCRVAEPQRAEHVDDVVTDALERSALDEQAGTGHTHLAAGDHRRTRRGLGRGRPGERHGSHEPMRHQCLPDENVAHDELHGILGNSRSPTQLEYPPGHQRGLRSWLDQSGHAGGERGRQIAEQQQHGPVPWHDERRDAHRFANQVRFRAIGQGAGTSTDPSGQARVVPQRLGRRGDLDPGLAHRLPALRDEGSHQLVGVIGQQIGPLPQQPLPQPSVDRPRTQRRGRRRGRLFQLGWCRRGDSVERGEPCRVDGMGVLRCRPCPRVHRGRHANTPPPSTTIVCPVTKPLAGLTSHSTAPTRSSGTMSRARHLVCATLPT